MRTGRLVGVILGMVALMGAAQSEPAPPIPDRNAQPALASGLDGSVHAVWAEGPLGSQVIRYSLWNGSVWSEPEGVVSDTSVSGLKVLVRSEDVVCVYWTVIGLLETCRVSGVWTGPNLSRSPVRRPAPSSVPPTRQAGSYDSSTSSRLPASITATYS